jgi:predicted regulator of Ras-like GTPase activity (Roadblock/LC7/MglB family)
LPYLRLLQALLASVPGARAALLLDANGEIVVEAGPPAERDRYRLIGAYQGIHLMATQKAMSRYAVGALTCLIYRYAACSVVLRPLRDGYYLLLSLAPEANLGRALHASAETQVGLDAEL